ncbi:lipopolysaccharide transport periplasmic protein LptA [Variovorax sp. PBL-E5]|uniref:lipopolysaccharide transport periplasmic protein LptA n=1 Tax=Variovorax sp. PBL-E5 TaxID=434014 RepID=UPI0013167021|nr:lipopolysaccharide transport periplasmic protein LptA [Variovorax sp. PBL-E5]VTU39358.1 Lipopolysaccharide export system protein LptA precursor [Variovorax sp. PBL-E5]
MTSRSPSYSFRLLSRTVFLALALAGFGSAALAEKADRGKPMNIESDAMRYDDLKQTSVFTGNVVVTKGTIIIRGARIDVRQDPEGYQYGVVTAAPGKLAYYKQKRDAGVDEWIEGESEVIEYDSRADNVKFIRRAVMRRLIGAKVNDESSGPLIVYDQSNDTFTVNGSTLPPDAGVSAPASGRVKAILTPKAQPPVAPASAGASAPAAKPAAPAPVAAPGTGLRSSTTLDGEPRK